MRSCVGVLLECVLVNPDAFLPRRVARVSAQTPPHPSGEGDGEIGNNSLLKGGAHSGE